MNIEKLYINYQISYDFPAKLSFFVCTKSPRSRNFESIISIIARRAFVWDPFKFRCPYGLRTPYSVRPDILGVLC